jgi:pseudouridylate synthase
MKLNLPACFHTSSEFARSLALSLPVVALESTVITHGLPYPENLDLARDMENEVRSLGAVPATIAVIAGQIWVGVNEAQLETLAGSSNMVKISSRDLGQAAAKRQTGGTTVAATLSVAGMAGIKVFATGGIGGVHRQIPGDPASAFDISADLLQLARVPLVVVCAGAKAILDLRATLEVLETFSVPVIGYQTSDFPAFYSASSGLRTSGRADSPEEVAKIALAHWELGNPGAILVAQPPPDEFALPREKVEQALEQALADLRREKVTGQGVTPFLLRKMKEYTSGSSLEVNLALLKKNARLAAQIARYLTPTPYSI